jgi:putative methyltransferase (TIGR01177 family)
MYFSFLSGVSERLAKCELTALIDSYGGRIVSEGKRIVVFEGKFPFSRLSLSAHICELVDNFEGTHFKDYSITVLSNDSPEARESVIKRIAKRVRGNVNLSKPKDVIGVAIEGGKEYIGKIVFSYDPREYEKRRPKNRPYFHPTTLDSRLARAIVNISGVRENESLLDPFCGSGAFLIEAGLIGAKGIGVDLSEKMILGCRQNLGGYGIKKYRLIQGDARDISVKADFLVTDMPYGRGSSLFGENKNTLNSDFLNLLPKLFRRRAVVVSDSQKKIPGTFEIIPLKVHRSLTRYVHIIDRKA